ncbi:MFS transporter [Rhodococcus sp. NPDC057014]|uniref:MFS transporter n=1 Tax=unclassified Rhodococcus (in: high G+C Gram-positive bacteria) TaxID=192944 RepID=UPI003637F604
MTTNPSTAAGGATTVSESGSAGDSKRASRAAFVGTLLEYYDFSLYASAASVVFGSVFFSGASPFLATLQAVGTFAVGFLVRPIGGVVLGSLGDRIGRKKILVFTLVMMGAATMLVGLLPGYEQIGWLAPALLVLLRILQGIGASAEYGGATLVAVEFAPQRRKGLLGSLPGAGASIGGVLGTSALLIVSAALPEEAFMSWGWRLPFLLSGLILLYGLSLRARLPETPAFRHIEETDGKTTSPVLDVIRSQPRAILSVLVMVFGQAGLGYFYLVFMLTFGRNQLGMGQTDILIGLVLAQLSCAAFIPLFGMLSDRVGRRPVIISGFVFSALLAFPAFWLVGHGGGTAAFWLVLVLGNGVGVAAIFGPMGAYVTELFETRHAFSGLGLGRELGNALGAALVPVLAVQLAFNDGGSTAALSILLVAISVAGVAAAWVSVSRTTRARDGAERAASSSEVAV